MHSYCCAVQIFAQTNFELCAAILGTLRQIFDVKHIRIPPSNLPVHSSPAHLLYDHNDRIFPNKCQALSREKTWWMRRFVRYFQTCLQLLCYWWLRLLCFLWNGMFIKPINIMSLFYFFQSRALIYLKGCYSNRLVLEYSEFMLRILYILPIFLSCSWGVKTWKYILAR